MPSNEQCVSSSKAIETRQISAEEQLLTQQQKERALRWIKYPNPGTRDSQEAAHVMNERHIAEIKALTGHM